MRLTFVLDSRFYLRDDGVYAQDQFPQSYWQRFLDVFDTVTVVARRGTLPPGARVDRFNLSSREGVDFRLLDNLSSLKGQALGRRRIRRQMAEAIAQGDAVVVRLPSENGLLAIRVARELGRPCAIMLTGCPWDGLWNHGRFAGKLYAPIMAWRVRRAARRARFVWYVTQHFLQRRYPSPGAVTASISNVEIAAPEPDVLARRLRRIAESRSPVVFGLIGSLKTQVKGVHIALAAFSQVKDRLPPFEFRVLGGGDAAPWRKMADELGLGGQVVLEGSLPSGAPVMNWLDGIDIYLQPSLKEGLPRALIEAMSRGCPAIASRCAGIPELLDENMLCEPGDAQGLARLLLRYGDDTEWKRAQAERNWNAAKDYAMDELTSRRKAFLGALRDAAARSGAET
ncbi:MAG: glycosyltransferase family 4 protein [Parvibaculum sp.]|nr:glycosyltransferase family 4 protein [Parvibaculum sp.]